MGRYPRGLGNRPEVVYNPRVFTGLVRTLGSIEQLRVGEESKVFTIASTLPLHDLEIGASVAVSGVCLTVLEAHPVASGEEGRTRFSVEAAFETLRLTTLEALRVGASVNLEPSLRVGDALGGHFVSGHVDGVAIARSITARGDARAIAFDIPAPLRSFMAVKGSVALDGVSLTINDVDDDGIWVGIIPHTLQATTLGRIAVGDRVNVEVDVVARYVARLHGGAPSSSRL